ncbi:PQQ-binding-like beta-propeller repeat protein [Streptomyces milbemycinicus]|uniref:outer membrane protein assembly factor BamB family protein n=1 Tax=Streptomyces milbemycinicus TaxID=476552 RepID=UPI0033F566F1
MGAQRAVRGTAAAMLTLVLSACGSGDGADDQTEREDTDKPASAPAHGPKGFAAPVKFSTAQAVALPDSAGVGKSGLAGYQRPLPIALHKGVAFISRPDGLEVSDTLQASDPLLITPEHEPVTKIEQVGGGSANNPAEAPLITSVGGRTLAFNALVTDVPGSGTSKGHEAVELMATDTTTATKSWFVEIELVEEEDEFADDRDEAYVVGRSGDTVVVFARGEVFGVDIKSHKRAWKADKWYRNGPVAVGDTIVAVTNNAGSDYQVIGLDGANGKQVWKSPRVNASESGSGLDVTGPDSVLAYEYADGTEEDEEAEGREYLLDAATGRVRRAFPEDSPTGRCSYDGLSVTVCWSTRWDDEASTHIDEAAAYDPKSGKELWKLPDASSDRMAPKVTLVRQGLIYGTTENGPVVVDARTGQDKEDAPGIAPSFTDGYVGVTETLKGVGYTAYRAVG